MTFSFGSQGRTSKSKSSGQFSVCIFKVNSKNERERDICEGSEKEERWKSIKV